MKVKTHLRVAEERLGLERGYIPQPFWNDFGDAMMEERAVVAALDKFAFDGMGYSAATANRMREAFSAAFTAALTALGPEPNELERTAAFLRTLPEDRSPR